MRPLKYQFAVIREDREIIYTQLRQSGQAFMYQVNSGERIYYEVFKRKVNEGRKCIMYPNSKSYGDWAWVYLTYDAAISEFNLLHTYDQ